MSLLWVLVIVLVVLAVVGAPGVGPWQHGWGYAPSGVLTVIVVIVLILLLTGRL